MNHLLSKIQSPGPKRVLSLDGGGIRGALALGYLSKIEQVLREKHGDPQLRLCDYFDLIGGTSTGAIIAACLARGWEVKDIREQYVRMGKTIFADKKSFIVSLFSKARFNDDALKAELCAPEPFGDRRLDSADLATCLAIFTKRVDTNTLWALTNNPGFQKYENTRHIPLWRIIKASSAPPTVFEAVEINAFSEEEPPFMKGAFTDGAVSIAGNPALWLLMMTQVDGYGFNWKTGENDLFMVSVGTGREVLAQRREEVLNWRPLDWAGSVIEMFLHDSKEMCEIMLQMLSKTSTPRFFGDVLGFLQNESLAIEPLLTYQRYDMLIAQHTIAALDEKFSKISLNEVDSLKSKTEGKNAAKLFDIGLAAAQKSVKAEHFPEVFDRRMAA